jgi:hypothetical protein
VLARTALATALAVTVAGAKCVTAAEDAVVVMNIERLSHNYLVLPGTTGFTNPNDCVTQLFRDSQRGFGFSKWRSADQFQRALEQLRNVTVAAERFRVAIDCRRKG